MSAPNSPRSGRTAPPLNRRRTLQVAVTAIVALALLSVVLAALAPVPTRSRLAAIVNNDKPVEVDGQLAPMGRQLTAELVSLEGTYEWQITTTERAEAGLASGKYAAAVLIPEDFSTHVTSLSSLSDAVQATVDLRLAPGASHTAGTEVELEVWKATAALGSMMTEQFVAGIFGGLGEMGDQLQTAADGATQLADGTKEAQAGALALADGGHQLADGAGQAADGLGQLAAGTEELGAGLGQLADGAWQAADGNRQLAGGLGQLAAGGSQLAVGADDLAAGTQAFTVGLQEYVAGVVAAADGVNQLNTEVQKLAPILAELENALGGLDVNVEELVDQFLAQLEVILDELPAAIDDFCAGQPDSPLCTPEIRDALDAALEQWLGDLRQQIEEGLAEEITAEIRALLEDITAGLGQFGELLYGIQQLSDGMNQLAQAGSNELVPGARELAGGMRLYAAGVGQFADGVGQTAQGAGALASGSAQLAAGASEAAGGVGQLSDGAWQAADGVGQIADGAGQLGDGAGELGGGLGQIGDGVGQLADGLGMAGDEIPDIDAAQAEALGASLASPIMRPSLSLGTPAAPAVGLALLLWLTTLLLQSVFTPAVSHLSSSTRPALLLTLSALRRPLTWSAAIGAGGGLILSLVGTQGFTNSITLILMAALAGAIFASVQQALALLLGRGWITVSVAALVLGVSAALSGTTESTLTGIARLLPAGEASQVFAFLIVPGMPSASVSTLLLVLWGALAITVSSAATANKRRDPEMAAATATA